MPSIRAADTAWRTSRPPWKDGEGVLTMEVGDGERGGGSGSPRSMKTSQTRSWAGKGME